MCGRYTLRVPASDLVRLLPNVEWPNLTPRYNIAPTQLVLAVRQKESGADYEAAQLRWGLIPSWADDLKIGHRLINARSEEAATKPSFRAAFKKRRCLLLADGFYEWETIGKTKIPHHFHLRDQSPFAMAGLWEYWKKDEQEIESCTILTTSANKLLEKFHNRMPVILQPNQFATWLNPTPQDPAILQEMMQPFDADRMAELRANPTINKASADSLRSDDELFVSE